MGEALAGYIVSYSIRYPSQSEELTCNCRLLHIRGERCRPRCYMPWTRRSQSSEKLSAYCLLPRRRRSTCSRLATDEIAELRSESLPITSNSDHGRRAVRMSLVVIWAHVIQGHLPTTEMLPISSAKKHYWASHGACISPVVGPLYSLPLQDLGIVPRQSIGLRIDGTQTVSCTYSLGSDRPFTRHSASCPLCVLPECEGQNTQELLRRGGTPKASRRAAKL